MSTPVFSTKRERRWPTMTTSKRRRSCGRCSRISRHVTEMPLVIGHKIGIHGGAPAPGASEIRVTITRIGEGVYRVEHDGRSELVYVAADSRTGRWAFWNGRVWKTGSGIVSE